MYMVKFSKLWDKMVGCELNKLKLKRCDISRVSVLSDNMIKEDRLYKGRECKDFKFNFDKCIILVIGDDKKNFITIRSYNSDKYRFYSRLVGKRVGIKFPISYDIMSDLNYHNSQQRLL